MEIRRKKQGKKREINKRKEGKGYKRRGDWSFNLGFQEEKRGKRKKMFTEENLGI